MYPTKARIKELQERFGVHDGQFFGHYRFKNLNWYLAQENEFDHEKNEWFCYGDIRDEDIPRLQEALEPGEVLFLGWKELGPYEIWDNVFQDGGGPWMIISKTDIPYDFRRDRLIKNTEESRGV